MLDTCSDRVKHSSEVRLGYRRAKSSEVRKWVVHLFLAHSLGIGPIRSASLYCVIGCSP